MKPAEGSVLRAEVDRQLLADLGWYGVHDEGLSIDWSDECPEGHCTRFLDSVLESVSGLGVRNAAGGLVAEGWIDFVHGAPDLPLHVYWLYLSVLRDGKWHHVKRNPTLPEHVWSRLCEASRLACVDAGTDDPLVRALMRGRG